MKSNFGKLAFVAAVIFAVLFSHFAYPGGPSGGLANAGATSSAAGARANAVPLFVMPSVALSASEGEPPPATPDDATPASPSVFSNVGSAPPPSLDDAASLVADLTTGAVIESVNPDRRWPTASLTKLMTATVVLDKLDPATRITITEPMFAVDPQDETTLVVGGTYTVKDLLFTLLMPSSNVAAEAFADFYGRDAFMAEMNARAAEWGMTNTHFDDPSGISASNQSTADDFLKLALVIEQKYPQILQTTENRQVYITEQNSGKKVLVTSINDFAGDPDFIGGKTGHTDQADGNLFSIFRYDGHPLLIVVLGTNNRFIDTDKLYAWFKANYK